MNDYQVTVLKPGYATWVGPSQQRADGSITLVKGPKNILVDTGGPWDKQNILRLLRRENVKPTDIDFVVCTHGHSDHTGNNNLFPNATLILSYDVCKGDLYIFHDFTHGQPYKIDEEVEVIPTPGHTDADVSVFVHTKNGTYAIAGDLFETEDDRADESLWRSFSEHPEQQEQNRQKVLEIADFIVPGHGNIFKVGKRQLPDQYERSEKDDETDNGRLPTKVVWQVIVPLVVAVAGGLLVWLLTTRGNAEQMQGPDWNDRMSESNSQLTISNPEVRFRLST